MQTEDILTKADEDLGAAMMLAGRYPLQATRLMLDALKGACLAVLAAEGEDFDPGMPSGFLVDACPRDVWKSLRPNTVAAMAKSAGTYLRSGKAEGDIRQALEADLPRVALMLEDARGHVRGLEAAPAP